MTPEQIAQLTPGIYRCYWQAAGSGIAAIGSNGYGDGSCWLAVANSIPVLRPRWETVERVEKIEIPEKGETAAQPVKDIDLIRLERENNELRAEVERQKQRAEQNAALANEFTYNVLRLEKGASELRAEVARLEKLAYPANVVKPPAPDVLELFQRNLEAFVTCHGSPRNTAYSLEKALHGPYECLKLAREGKEWKPAVGN